MKCAKATILTVTVCLMVSAAFLLPADMFLAAQPEDNWTAHPMYISQFAEPHSFSGYNVTDIRTAYNLPSSGGAGVTIAIIDAYHTPTISTDLAFFSNYFDLPAPDATNFEVHKMSSYIGTDADWAQETTLDVEWAHAIAPDAKILLVEAVSNHNADLLAAVNYARNRQDVVAISMSWGGDEFYGESGYNSFFTSNYGAVFFASSGDNGSEVCWPATSSNVIAVGGTTLNLNGEGAVLSETGWNGSGGGVSSYESIPSYQINYGIIGTKRNVPDVSYNANPSTGVKVRYNNQWYIFGGTSAGAPQWAAIYALTLSASNTNLYQKAKIAYSAYFRDITTGSNGGYTASTGYDCVTGLGSPLTCDFRTLFEITPTSGPAGADLTLSGTGFLGSAVNLSYLNPVNNSWVSIANNTATIDGNFDYALNAPDLLQNNLAGDNPAQSESIVFRAVDNSNGRSYNSTVPYTEYRRGLTQVGSTTAQGIYGNNTDLTAKAFVHNDGNLHVAGEWFNPDAGNVSLLWDGSNIANVAVDGNGFIDATVPVPATSIGQHTLTINDNAQNFCINLTCSPATIASDYSDVWHTSDFTVNLTTDYPVNGTFYRINGGAVQNVADGQPTITAEGAGNTLEYWSTWNLNSTTLVDLPPDTINIKLDKTAPTGAITASTSMTQTRAITLYLSADDAVSGVAQMRFADEYSGWSIWEQYAASKPWTLQGDYGEKTVSVQYIDNAGLASPIYSCTVTLQQPSIQSPQTSTSPSQTPSAATPTQTPAEPTDSPITNPTPQIPEFQTGLVLLFFVAVTMLAVTAIIRRK